MATLLDTSALVVFLRSRRPTPGHERLARVVGEELRAGRGLVSAVTAVELLVGGMGATGRARLGEILDRLPVVGMDREVAGIAGSMGAYLRSRGASVPQVDLAIAATAVWLDVPLLTCDSDFLRGRRVALDLEGGSAGGRSAPRHAAGTPGLEEDLLSPQAAWTSLLIHPASVA